MSDPANPPRVAVAIVTSHLGVLVGRRRDGNPPWTFPGGKIELGESPEDTAVRETLEETGFQVRGTGIIGQRAHPRTGVSIVYVAAVLASKGGARAREVVRVFANPDGRELTEARWVSLVENETLMGKMIYEPVRDYLRQALER